MDQVNTAITNGANLLIVNIVENSSPDAAQNVVNAAKEKDIPVIFFNRDFDASVINSYEKCAFVGTDPAEAGHMQGKMIADYLLANYDATDLNGDGSISYVMFKGQEGNVEAEYRTQYSVEDANAQLTGAGKAELTYYGGNDAATKYLVLVHLGGLGGVAVIVGVLHAQGIQLLVQLGADGGDVHVGVVVVEHADVQAAEVAAGVVRRGVVVRGSGGLVRVIVRGRGGIVPKIF